MERKICVVTGSRSEYGLLRWLIQEIDDDKALNLQLIVTGSHLSTQYGLTYKEIEKDGFQITEKINMKLSSDTSKGVTKSMGNALIGFAQAYEKLVPDIVVVMGDRFEIFCAVCAAMVARIPVAHLNGGETTEGAIDEAIRHSITKMAHFHFTAMDEYTKRVVQLGEDPKRIFTVGEVGLDNIRRLKLLKKDDFEKSINFKLNKKNLLVTYHPATLEMASSRKTFQIILDCLHELKDTNLIFTKPNADMDNQVIAKMIDAYVKKNKKHCVQFTSLGQLRYLSALQYVDGVVGNSSSGIVEVPSFKKGTINVGDRQKGRVRAKNVIDCQPTRKSLRKGFQKLCSASFQKSLKCVTNPYGDGKASKKVKDILKKVDLNNVMKKKFYDVSFKLPNM